MLNPIDDNEVSLHYDKMFDKSDFFHYPLCYKRMYSIHVLFENLPIVMSSINLRKEDHEKCMYF